MKQYHISQCCKADLFFKGPGNGFWCSKCKKEITHTFVAFGYKEIKKLKEIRDKNTNFLNNTIYVAREYGKVIGFFLTDNVIEFSVSYNRVDFPRNDVEIIWQDNVTTKAIDECLSNISVSDPDFKFITYKEYENKFKKEYFKKFL